VRGSTFRFYIKKLPKFCEMCGLFGHGELECGNGVHNDDDKQYGDWMCSPIDDWHPQTSGVRVRTAGGEASRGGRGGGRGGGRPSESRKCPPVESPNAGEKANPSQLQVTDGSGKNGEKEDPGARRNLDLALREEDGTKEVGTNASPGAAG
jgi:hypothetical protein